VCGTLFFKPRSGFTFLETLLVVAAMGILASIVVVAVNPAKQLGDTRNAARQVDVITLVSAMYQYSIDSEGKIPPSIPVGTGCGAGEKQEICKIGGAACGKKVNLYDFIVSSTARFLIGIPSDPTVTTGTGTGYEIYRDAITNRVVVCAPRAEQKAVISAAR
jgi:type IV pilus assembly protein PilA